MKTVRLSDGFYSEIAGFVRLLSPAAGNRQSDGSWILPIATRFWKDLQRQSRTGESDEDTLARLMDGAALWLGHMRLY